MLNQHDFSLEPLETRLEQTCWYIWQKYCVKIFGFNICYYRLRRICTIF